MRRVIWAVLVVVIVLIPGAASAQVPGYVTVVNGDFATGSCIPWALSSGGNFDCSVGFLRWQSVSMSDLGGWIQNRADTPAGTYNAALVWQARSWGLFSDSAYVTVLYNGSYPDSFPGGRSCDYSLNGSFVTYVCPIPAQLLGVGFEFEINWRTGQPSSTSGIDIGNVRVQYQHTDLPPPATLTPTITPSPTITATPVPGDCAYWQFYQMAGVWSRTDIASDRAFSLCPVASNYGPYQAGPGVRVPKALDEGTLSYSTSSIYKTLNGIQALEPGEKVVAGMGWRPYAVNGGVIVPGELSDPVPVFDGNLRFSVSVNGGVFSDCAPASSGIGDVWPNYKCEFGSEAVGVPLVGRVTVSGGAGPGGYFVGADAGVEAVPPSACLETPSYNFAVDGCFREHGNWQAVQFMGSFRSLYQSIDTSPNSNGGLLYTVLPGAPPAVETRDGWTQSHSLEFPSNGNGVWFKWRLNSGVYGGVNAFRVRNLANNTILCSFNPAAHALAAGVGNVACTFPTSLRGTVVNFRVEVAASSFQSGYNNQVAEFDYIYNNFYCGGTSYPCPPSLGSPVNVTPTPAPTATVIPTATPVSSPAATSTALATFTVTPVPSSTVTVTPGATATRTPIATFTPGPTRTPTATPDPLASPTAVPTMELPVIWTPTPTPAPPGGVGEPVEGGFGRVVFRLGQLPDYWFSRWPFSLLADGLALLNLGDPAGEPLNMPVPTFDGGATVGISYVSVDLSPIGDYSRPATAWMMRLVAVVYLWQRVRGLFGQASVES